MVRITFTRADFDPDGCDSKNKKILNTTNYGKITSCTSVLYRCELFDAETTSWLYENQLEPSMGSGVHRDEPNYMLTADTMAWTGHAAAGMRRPDERGAAGAVRLRAQGWLGTAPSPGAVGHSLRRAWAAAPSRTPSTLLPLLALLRAPAGRPYMRRQAAGRGGRVTGRHPAGPRTPPPCAAGAKDAAARGPRRPVRIGRGTWAGAGLAAAAGGTAPAAPAVRRTTARPRDLGRPPLPPPAPCAPSLSPLPPSPPLRAYPAPLGRPLRAPYGWAGAATVATVAVAVAGSGSGGGRKRVAQGCMHSARCGIRPAATAAAYTLRQQRQQRQRRPGVPCAGGSGNSSAVPRRAGAIRTVPAHCTAEPFRAPRTAHAPSPPAYRTMTRLTDSGYLPARPAAPCPAPRPDRAAGPVRPAGSGGARRPPPLNRCCTRSVLAGRAAAAGAREAGSGGAAGRRHGQGAGASPAPAPSGALSPAPAPPAAAAPGPAPRNVYPAVRPRRQAAMRPCRVAKGGILR